MDVFLSNTLQHLYGSCIVQENSVCGVSLAAVRIWIHKRRNDSCGDNRSSCGDTGVAEQGSRVAGTASFVDRDQVFGDILSATTESVPVSEIMWKSRSRLPTLEA